MTQSMGTLDFFLLEGGEYLERLDALAQAPAGSYSQGDELLRLSRAFRGSAIMASQHGMSRAGQGLESCARAIREGRLAWTVATRAEMVRAIDDAKILMRRLRTPEQGDTEKAETIGIGLDRMSGRASAQIRAAAGPGLDAGGRAFVAREAASIASVLQHSARTLRGDPANRDVLVSIGPAMSALRGVAILNDLPPLGEILSAIEHAAKDVLAAGGTLGAEVSEVFEAGGRALARAAREVVDAGRPDAEAEESHAFAARLFTVLTGGGVVSVESLFCDDAGPHIVHQGEAPAPSGTGLARVEMVSHGEYLNAAAAELGRVATPVQRDLRLYGIAASVRPMVGAGGSPLSAALGRLAEAARDAIGRGAASHRVEDFINHIREAAAALAAAQSGDEQRIADRIGAAASSLAMLTASVATRSMPSIAAPLVEEPAAASAGAAPAAPATPAAPAAAAAPATAPAPTPPPAAVRVTPPPSAPVLAEVDIATSYLTLEQLIAERGLPMGTLGELIAGGVGAATPSGPVAGAEPAPRTTVPRSMAPAPAGVPVSLAPEEAGVVPVQSLVYRGESALRRALELKSQLAAAQSDSARLQALLNEVFELVELGLGSAR